MEVCRGAMGWIPLQRRALTVPDNFCLLLELGTVYCALEDRTFPILKIFLKSVLAQSGDSDPGDDDGLFSHQSVHNHGLPRAEEPPGNTGSTNLEGRLTVKGWKGLFPELPPTQAA